MSAEGSRGFLSVKFIDPTQTVMKHLIPILALSTSLAATAATYNWSGGTGSLNSTNYDTGTSPYNGSADIVNLTNGGYRASSSSYDLEGADTYNLSNGGVIQNFRGEGKALKGNGATINVGADSYAGAARFRDATINLTDNGTYLAGNGPDNGGDNFLQNSTLNFPSTWTGEIYFAASTSGDPAVTVFDQASDVTDWLDGSNGTNRLFLDGVALTSADLGTKFLLTPVTAGS